LNKLQVIHSFAAQKSVWNSHNKNLLNMGQSGSRPGCRAIKVAIQKEMKYTYAKLTQTPLATIYNNAKSYFDRFFCNVAMLVSPCYGVPTKYCKLQSTTLQNTEFRI
jgi:hypothetical protein